MHATVGLEPDIAHRLSDYMFVTIAPLTSPPMSLSLASTWASGLSPASPKRGTTSLAILSSSFTIHTVRVGLVYTIQAPYRRTTDRQSKVFEPTTIEIKFQRLHKVEEGSDSQQANLVPIIQPQPSPEDSPGFMRLVSIFHFCAILYRRDCAHVSCFLQAEQ